MGKPTGFMDLEKVDRGYKPVSERISNYKEFVIPLSSVLRIVSSSIISGL